MIFVDTSAWFAAVVPTDSDYLQAARWLAANSEQLLTTDYVIDENTHTFARTRRAAARASAGRKVLRVLNDRGLFPD